MLPDFTLPDLTPVQQLGEVIIGFLPRIVAAIAIFLAFYFVNKIIQRLLRKYSGITRMPEDITLLLRRTLSLVMNVIGVITALGTLGIDVSALIAGLGLTGFALGFALQDIISNFLAGVLLTIHRPFRRGNYIRVGDKEGIVVDMDLRYTVLQRDTIKILIPNSMLFKDAIIIANRMGEPIPPNPPSAIPSPSIQTTLPQSGEAQK